MEHNVVFDSIKCPNGELINLASGFISLTKVEFKNENIVALIESKTGEINFCDLQSNNLLSTKTETPQSGDDKFSEVKCIVEGNQIKLGFPKYDYKDNYPNCDGEYDRWTKTISGYDYLIYDFIENCIV